MVTQVGKPSVECGRYTVKGGDNVETTLEYSEEPLGTLVVNFIENGTPPPTGPRTVKEDTAVPLRDEYDDTPTSTEPTIVPDITYDLVERAIKEGKRVIGHYKDLYLTSIVYYDDSGSIGFLMDLLTTYIIS